MVAGPVTVTGALAPPPALGPLVDVVVEAGGPAAALVPLGELVVAGCPLLVEVFEPPAPLPVGLEPLPAPPACARAPVAADVPPLPTPPLEGGEPALLVPLPEESALALPEPLDDEVPAEIRPPVWELPPEPMLELAPPDLTEPLPPPVALEPPPEELPPPLGALEPSARARS